MPGNRAATATHEIASRWSAASYAVKDTRESESLYGCYGLREHLLGARNGVSS